MKHRFLAIFLVLSLVALPYVASMGSPPVVIPPSDTFGVYGTSPGQIHCQ